MMDRNLLDLFSILLYGSTNLGQDLQAAMEQMLQFDPSGISIYKTALAGLFMTTLPSHSR